MKFILTFALIGLSVLGFSQDQEAAEKIAERAFIDEIHNIQKKENMIVQFHRINSDNLSKDTYFVIVEYGLGAKGANKTTIKKAKLYKVNGKSATFLSDFEPDYCFSVIKISKDKVKIDETPACMFTRNTTAIKHKFVLSGNTLEEK